MIFTIAGLPTITETSRILQIFFFENLKLQIFGKKILNITDIFLPCHMINGLQIFNPKIQDFRKGITDFGKLILAALLLQEFEKHEKLQFLS